MPVSRVLQISGFAVIGMLIGFIAGLWMTDTWAAINMVAWTLGFPVIALSLIGAGSGR